MSYIYEKRVKYYETDNMGVVHHSNYIRWFEEARVEFMRDSDLSYKDMEKDGIMIPVVSVECNYKSPAKFDDEIECETKISKYNGIIVEIKYEVRDKQTGAIRVTGKSSHCFVDAISFKPLNLKRIRPDMSGKFERIMEE